jgi:hypothetical protein
LKNLLTSDEKATDFLLAHPGIIDTIKGDVEYEYNEDQTDALLYRFTDKVQLACAKQELEDRDRMRQALETTINQLQGETGAQSKENANLKKENAVRKRKIDAQAREIAALRNKVKEDGACDEVAAMTATASELNKAVDAKVRIEPGVETETRSSKRSKKQ